MNTNTDRIMDTDDAAEFVSLSKSTLTKLRLSGEGPRYLKLGRAVRYREGDLIAWMGARVVGSTSEYVSRRAG